MNSSSNSLLPPAPGNVSEALPPPILDMDLKDLPNLDRNISSKAVVGQPTTNFVPSPTKLLPKSILLPAPPSHFSRPASISAAVSDRSRHTSPPSHHSSPLDDSASTGSQEGKDGKEKRPPRPSKLILPELRAETPFNLSGVIGWVKNVPLNSKSGEESDDESVTGSSAAGSGSHNTAHTDSKGKGRAHSIERIRALETVEGRPLIPLSTPDASTSQQASSSYVSVEARQPVRVRRVGALGISVSSESGDNRDRGEMADNDSGTGSRESVGIPLGIAEEADNSFDFRGIVDELSSQNQILKSRLKRYEATRVPVELKKDRLFEVRFFDGLASDKREELEAFLTSYVQGLTNPGAEMPAFPTPSTRIAPTELPPPVIPNPRPPPLISRPRKIIMPPNMIAPVRVSSPSSSTQPLKIVSNQSEALSKSSVPLPAAPIHSITLSNPSLVQSAPIGSATSKNSSSLPRKHQKRKLTDRELLASASYSGIEPESYSGTGNGMKFVSTLGTEGRRRAIDIAPATKLVRSQSEESRKAVEIVDVLERLFYDSIYKDGSQEESGAQNSGSNEFYLGRILSGDSEGAGWTYLRLVYNFCNLHRFSVTLAFVQASIRAFSTRLEISLDGGMVRWIGSTPSTVDSGTGFSGVASTGTLSEVASSGDTFPPKRPLVASKDSQNTVSTTATSIAMEKSPASSRQLRPITAPLPVSISPLPNTVLPPLAVGLTRQVTNTTSYVPFFDRRDEVTIISDLSRHGLNERGRDRGEGTRVYYANANFCSDLSTDFVAGVLYKEEEMEVDIAITPVVSKKALREDLLLPLPREEDFPLKDLVMYDGDSIVKPTSSYPPLRRLEISGTTEVQAADSFTHIVKTIHPRPVSSNTVAASLLSRKRRHSAIAQSTSKLTSPRRKVQKLAYAHRVLSTKIIHHPITVLPHRPARSYISSAVSSASLSSRGSGKRNHKIPEIVMSDFTEPSPPPPDYLLSLSCPFFAWAPTMTGIGNLDSFRSSSAMRSSARFVEDEENERVKGVGGAEGIINLDDEVYEKSEEEVKAEVKA